MEKWQEFLVLRFELQRNAYVEVARVDAPDAGDAFKRGVLERGAPVRGGVAPGEYLVLPTEGSARIGVELTLRDLDAEAAAKV